MAKQKYLRPLVKTIPTKIAVCISQSAFEKLQDDWGIPPSRRADWPFGNHSRMGAGVIVFNGVVVVALPEGVTTADIVHESVHVFEAVMRDIHEHQPSEEFRAYGTQAIFEAVTAEYKRLQKSA